MYLPQELSAPAARGWSLRSATALPVTVVAGLTGRARADAAVGAALASSRPHGARRRRSSCPAAHPRRVGVRPRRRSARGRAARRRRPARRRARSSAWRCSTARPSRTRAWCTSSSTPPGSRTTARRCARWPTACSAAGCSACSRCPTATSSATTSCVCSRRRRCSTRAAPRRRRGGSGSAAPPRSSAAPTSGSSASTATPVRRSSSSPPSSRSPSASRTPSTSRRSSRRPATLQEFVATLVADLAVDPGAGWRELAGWAERLVHDHLAPEPRRGAWPEVERRAAEKIEAALARLAGLDAVEATPGPGGVPAHARARARRRPRARRAPRRRPADGPRRAGARASTSTGSSCAAWPRASSRPACATTRCSPTPTDAPPMARSPCAPRASTTTTGACSRRWPERRSNACSCSPAATSAAPPSACRRGSSSRASPPRSPGHAARRPRRACRPTGTRRYRRSPPASPGSSSPPPSRSTGCARCSTTRVPVTRSASTSSREVDVALRRGIETVDGARPAARFTRFDGNLAGFDAGRVTDDDVVVSPTRLQTYAANPFDYFLEYVLRVDIAELPGGALRGVAARPRQPRARDPRHVPRRGARPAGRRAGARRALGRHRPRPAARDRRRPLRAVYEAQGRTGRRLFWHRDRAASSPSSTGSSPRIRPRAPQFGLRPVATELRFGFSDTAPAVDLPLSDGRVLRFRGAADRVDRTAGGALWVIDYKTGRPYGVDPDDPTVRGTMLQLPVYAHAARASFGDGRHPGGRRLLVREHPGAVPMGRARAHAGGRRTRRRRAARHRRRHRRRRVPLPGRPAEHVDAPVPQLHRSRRARHPRPLPRVARESAMRRRCAATSH